ncbi:Major intrinsic protein [Parasponia andersonii]|uniref:Major intrinsic protein n=1 Tax=Parasponia andersonii TaxID=3476 RepID=A0A2P5DSI2_PARAD|nr:Major intrinsic protein [Parasponia andersonii]
MNPVRTLGPAIASGNYRRLRIYMVGPPLCGLSWCCYLHCRQALGQTTKSDSCL